MYEKKLTAEEKLIQARMKLQKENPFFSFLTMQLNFYPSKDIETIGVSIDGDVPFNEEFIDSLDEATCKGVLCHEVLHCAFEHMSRRNGRDAYLWNIACDAVINNIVLKEDMRLPRDGVIPYNNKITIYETDVEELDNKSSDEVFDEVYSKVRRKQDKLNKSIKDYFKNHKDSKGGFDKHIEKKSGRSKKGKEEESIADKSKSKEKDWKKILIDACTHAEQQGNLPSGMRRMVDKLLETHIDWKGLLYRYITNQIPIDYIWTRPSKRSFSTGVYLPSVEKESIDVVVAIDTSGSISQDELSQFLTEVVSIIRTFRNVDLTIIDCDCEIQSAKTYKNARIDDALEFNLSGGGGTSHIPVFNWIKDNLPSARLLVAFTDGYTSFPDRKDVNLDTLWVVAGSWRANVEDFPFGQVIELPKQR